MFRACYSQIEVIRNRLFDCARSCDLAPLNELEFRRKLINPTLRADIDTEYLRSGEGSRREQRLRLGDRDYLTFNNMCSLHGILSSTNEVSAYRREAGVT